MNIGVPLHNHSEGSFLDGLASIEQIAQRTVEIGASAFAVTDHGEVNQHLQAQRMADKYNLKFVPGVEAYLVDSVARVREEKDRKNSHLCIFAEDNEGLKNLWSLTTLAYTKGQYYKPLFDWEMAAPYAKGLMVTDGCMLAYMARAILEDDEDAATNLVGQYIDTFGRDNFYMELHTWQFMEPKTQNDFKLNADMTKINQGKVAIAKKYGVPLIVVNDSHYANPEDWENHALVWEMSTHNNDDKSERGQTAAWIMDDSEMYYWMEKHGIGKSVVTEALHNTAEIAARCTARIESRLHLPSLTGSREGDKKLFLDQIEAGFQKKVVQKGLDQEVYAARVEEEVALILSKEFEGYFNVVADYVSHAKNNLHMLVGAGRGSGGGSLVNYLMDITAVDPIKYNLLFARFLTEARVDMPDIDVDFPKSRVKEIKEGYLPEKYGRDNVCLIGTLSRGKPAGIFKDIARAMKIPYSVSEEMAKIFDKARLPQGLDGHGAWLETWEQKSKELTPYRDRYPLLFEKAEEMMGLIRQSGTHAAGVLISDVPLLGEMPLRIKGKSGEMPITVFENSETAGNPDVSDMGYIKYDVLSLRTLDTLQAVFDIVKERHGLAAKTSTEFYENFGDAEYSDPKVWEIVAAGDTLGIFQIETGNALPSVKKMKPQNEWDMADLTSVIRPGVVKAGLLDVYFDRKDGRTPYKSIHPMLDSILDRTYGIVVYQEQAMKIFLQIGLYSPAETEKMRKLIGKKKVHEMEAEKPRFFERCLANEEFVRLVPRGSNPQRIVEDMWNNIEATGSYSFNEAHAIGYALSACQCAYMKYHYPAEYLTALLRTDPESIPLYVRAIRKAGIPILPPDINDSTDLFAIPDDSIRYGLTAVRGIAGVAYKEIRRHAPYKSFTDFLDRVSTRTINKTVVNNLISIGAFDRFGRRGELMQEFHETRKIKGETIPNFDDEEVVQKIEMELVGSYIQVDPIDRYREIIEGECIQSPDTLDSMLANETALIGGRISMVKPWTTKARQEEMAFIDIEWNSEQYSVNVFPRAFRGYKHFIKEGALVLVKVEKLEKGCHLKELVRLDRL